MMDNLSTNAWRHTLDEQPKNAGQRRSDMIKALQKRGHRLTPQRMAVVKILSESLNHPSVEQIYETIKADFPMTSLATVYKTVTLLKEMGLVLELAGSGKSSSRFDGIRDEPHPHLICLSCGEIVDLEPLEIESISNKIEHKTGYRIKSHNFTFHGLCSSCRHGEKRGRIDHAHIVKAGNI